MFKHCGIFFFGTADNYIRWEILATRIPGIFQEYSRVVSVIREIRVIRVIRVVRVIRVI